ncbi:DUF1828 domain-containing protein, partial [Streptococcus pneumoniae]|uniref:DUF1828 domain-containing protein n=1 Tax=Streptococcus pneumoniae TaxID=1313 RepID=UPI001CBF8FA1
NNIDVTKKGRRQDIFNSLLHFNGFDLHDGAIERTTGKEHLGQVIHDMTQLLMNDYDFIQLTQDLTSSKN